MARIRKKSEKERRTRSSTITDHVKQDVETEDFVTNLHKLLQELKIVCQRADPNRENIDTILGKYIVARTASYREEKRTTVLSAEREAILRKVILSIEGYKNALVQEGITDLAEGFEYVKAAFGQTVADMKQHLSDTQFMLDNMFLFIEDVFGGGQEMLVVVTELTVNYYSAKFISRYGCEKYFEHNKELLVYERQQELLSEIMLLNDADEIDLSIL